MTSLWTTGSAPTLVWRGGWREMSSRNKSFPLSYSLTKRHWRTWHQPQLATKTFYSFCILIHICTECEENVWTGHVRHVRICSVSPYKQNNYSTSHYTQLQLSFLPFFLHLWSF
jgi:hypothetical protein